MKIIIVCFALIVISAGAPSVALVEPTSILGRIEPQPEAPASTEHGKLIPALRYSPLLEPITTRLAYDYPVHSRYVAVPYTTPFEAHSYRISY